MIKQNLEMGKKQKLTGNGLAAITMGFLTPHLTSHCSGIRI